MNDNEKIIHLFVTSQCDHDCPLCCNKQYDIDKIPVVTVDELKNAHTVLITGGEPFLHPQLPEFIGTLRKQYPNIKALYVYTSGSRYIDKQVYNVIDGINFSTKGLEDFMRTLQTLMGSRKALQSLSSNRLYIFPEVARIGAGMLRIAANSIGNFEIINREWQEEFKPASGIFRRLPVLFNNPEMKQL